MRLKMATLKLQDAAVQAELQKDAVEAEFEPLDFDNPGPEPDES